VTESAGQILLLRVQQSLQDRRALLLFDSWKHLLPADSLISQVLEATAAVRVPATCAVFAGDWTAAAAVALVTADGDDSSAAKGVEGLMRWVNHSLIGIEVLGAAAPRYRMRGPRITYRAGRHLVSSYNPLPQDTALIAICNGIAIDSALYR